MNTIKIINLAIHLVYDTRNAQVVTIIFYQKVECT